MKPTELLTGLLSQYQSLSNDEQLLIAGTFKHCSFKDRDILLQSNTTSHKIFFVVKGVLRIASVNEKGIEITHWFFKENMLCTVVGSFKNQQPSAAFIQACCDAEVLTVTRNELTTLYVSVPSLEKTINLIFEKEMIEKIRARNSDVGASALDMYKLFLEQQPEIALRVSQKDIAGYLGITQQSLSRLRKHLQHQ